MLRNLLSRAKKAAKKGQSLVEYGLILALVAVMAIAALQFMGTKINAAATNSGNQVEKASANSGEAYCKSISKDYDSTTGLCKDTTTTP